VPETRIAFSHSDRRNGLLAIVGFTVVFSGLGWLGFEHMRNADAANRWAYPCMFALIWIPGAIYMADKTFGITKITEEGMQCRTLLGWRRVAWNDVTQIEVQRNAGRNGTVWWIVRAHCSQGKPIRIPGVMSNSEGPDREGFQERVDTICSAWHKATGRTDPVVLSR
jgi:hypothetical protein